MVGIAQGNDKRWMDVIRTDMTMPDIHREEIAVFLNQSSPLLIWLRWVLLEEFLRKIPGGWTRLGVSSRLLSGSLNVGIPFSTNGKSSR
jgi:hypothetical protein